MPSYCGFEDAVRSNLIGDPVAYKALLSDDETLVRIEALPGFDSTGRTISDCTFVLQNATSLYSTHNSAVEILWDKVNLSSAAKKAVPSYLKIYEFCSIAQDAKAKSPFAREARSHLDRLYSESASAEQDAIILGDAFELVEKAFSEGNLLLVNELLANLDPTRLRQVVAVGLLRATFRVRGNLSEWKSCLGRVWRLLESRDESPKHLLRGLVRDNDPTQFAVTTTVL